MKKRVVSLAMVLVIVFTGVFSCLASAADQSPIDILYDLWDQYVRDGKFFDFFGFGTAENPKDSMIDNIMEMEQTDNGSSAPKLSDFEYGILHNAFRTAWDPNDPCPLQDCLAFKPPGLKCTLYPGKYWSINFRYPGDQSAYTMSWAFFDSSGHPLFSHYYWNLRGIANTSITSYDYYINKVTYCYVRCAFMTGFGQYHPPQTINLNAISWFYEGYDDGFKWGWDDDCSWSSDFDINAINDLDITLMSDTPLDPNVQGEFYVTSGFYYNDGTDCVYAGEYVRSDNISSGQEWHWVYDMGAFSEYLYRKRCGFDHFYAFVSVFSKIENRYVYFDNMAVDPKPPGGIFDDTKPPPGWDDYKPQREPFPQLTINMTWNNSYQSISSVTIDQNTTFNDYFAWIDDSLNVLNENITIISDNIITFGSGFEDFLVYFGDVLAYIDESINADFDAIGAYLGDLIDTINFNTQIIIDNLKNYFVTKLIPDKDYVNFILRRCIGWYTQIQNLLSSKTFSEDSFEFYISPFEYTFVFDDAELAGQIKTLCSLIVLGCTALKCVRIGFQMFGINVGGGDEGDS